LPSVPVSLGPERGWERYVFTVPKMLVLDSYEFAASCTNGAVQ
jgi:hypothetical protein